MRKTVATALLGTMAFSLAACGDDRATETIDKAEGEILTRSVTDDMLPYEQLRSQPPLADPDELEKEKGGTRPPASGGGESPTPEDATSGNPEPAVTPDAE